MPEPVGALVAETEDALAVGDDDHGDLVVGDRSQHLLEAVRVRIRQEQPTMVLVDHAELLARLADHRRVDDRHQRLDVVEQQAQEQRLVVVLHVAQEHVSLEIGLEQGVLRPDAVGPLLDRLDVGREQPVEPEGVPLGDRERRALVGQRVGQQVLTGHRDRQRLYFIRHGRSDSSGRVSERAISPDADNVDRPRGSPHRPYRTMIGHGSRRDAAG